MKKKLKSCISALLAASLLVGCAASNPAGPEDGDPGDRTEITSPDSSGSGSEAEETEETRLPSALPDTDLDGFTLTMLQCHFAEGGAWREELTGENVNDAIFNRNIYLQDKYDCRLDLVESADWHPCEKEIPEAVASGDDLYDVVFDGGGAFASRIDHYKNLNALSYLSFDMPWWNKEFNEGITLDGKLFFTIGAFMTSARQCVYHVILDKTVAEDHGIGGSSLYDLVREDRWTLDRMLEYAGIVSTDLNGDGKMDQHDLWGLLGQTYVTWTLALGAGFRCAKIGEDGRPELTFGCEHNVNVMDKVLRIAGDKKVSIFAERIGGVADVWETYQEINDSNGRWLFTISLFGSNYRELEDDIGVLPSPKYDESQTRYYHDASLPNSPTAAIPVSATDADLSAFLLEAMSYESFYRVLPIFYDEYLNTKMVRDEDSVEMLRIIHNSLYYDVGALFNWGGMLGTIQSMSSGMQNTLASKFASQKKGIEKAMGRTLKKLEGLD